MNNRPKKTRTVDNPPVAKDAKNAEDIKSTVHRRLLETLDFAEARRMPVEQLHAECSRRVDVLLNEQGTPLSSPEKQKLLLEVMDEIFGLGPVEEFLRDPDVTDILVNGPESHAECTEFVSHDLMFWLCFPA